MVPGICEPRRLCQPRQAVLVTLGQGICVKRCLMLILWFPMDERLSWCSLTSGLSRLGLSGTSQTCSEVYSSAQSEAIKANEAPPPSVSVSSLCIQTPASWAGWHWVCVCASRFQLYWNQVIKIKAAATDFVSVNCLDLIFWCICHCLC